MKSFRTPAILGAVATVLLTSGAAFAGTVPASTASAPPARPRPRAPVRSTRPAAPVTTAPKPRPR